MKYEDFWQQAMSHHGTAAAIEERFPEICTEKQLEKQSDAFYLSAITRRVFRAGIRHSVVDSRWPAFEEAFWNFNPVSCQLIDDSRFEVLMQNAALIRHWGKMKTIPVNAQMVANVSKEHGSFGEFIAQWPATDIVGLWQFFKKQGAYLGGHGASRFLRMVGKDTFVLADDVVRALVNAGVVSKHPTSQRDLKATQGFFNELAEQSHQPLSTISMVLACSVGR